MRKLARKIVKKYKKTARMLGLNRLIGEKHVVSPEEHQANVESVIKQVGSETKIILLDTVPNKDDSRNDAIKRYNTILQNISFQYTNVIYISLYHLFEDRFESLYLTDGAHINKKGYELIHDTIERNFLS